MSAVNWKSELQRWCQQQRIGLPVYSHQRKSGGGWVSSVHIHGVGNFRGYARATKVEADQSVARKTLLIVQDRPVQDRPLVRQPRRQNLHEEPRHLEFKYDPFSDDEILVEEEPPSPPHEFQPMISNGVFDGISLSNGISRTFQNNCFDLDMISHLQTIVRGKSVEITNNPSYPTATAPIVIYLLPSQVNQVTSTLLPTGFVKIVIPALPIEKMPYQAVLWLTACMEFGAASVAITDTNFAVSLPNNINVN